MKGEGKGHRPNAMRGPVGNHSGNLSSLNVGSLPEGRPRRSVPGRDRVSILLGIAGFATTILVCSSSILERPWLEFLPLEAWVSLTLFLFSGHLLARSRPIDLGTLAAPAAGEAWAPPGAPAVGDPDPVEIRRGGLLAGKAKAPPPRPVPLVRWTYFRKGSLSN